jgi:hypothetical protein
MISAALKQRPATASAASTDISKPASAPDAGRADDGADGMADQDLRNMVSRVDGRLDEIIKAVERQGDDSRNSRTAMYERLNALGSQLQSDTLQMRAEIHQISERLSRVEPIAATVTDWKAQRNGFLWLGGALTAIITAGVALGTLMVTLLKDAG